MGPGILSGVTVGDQVRKSLDNWSAKEWNRSVAHACDAVAETARKRYPTMGVAARFKKTIRDEVDIFGAMTAFDFDFVRSRFPIPVQSDLPDGKPDIADVLFGVHRFLDGHEEELPAGVEITPHAEGVPMFLISRGNLKLRASAALGLLAVAVFAPENKGEVIPDTYNLGWQQHRFHIIGWWGWQDHFREIVAGARVQQVPLDFGAEWAHWQPAR